jgi:predicted transcriptional regulator
MVWMITVHKGFVKSFLEGEKDIELRTRIPKDLQPGDDILVAQAGSGNKVVLHLMVWRIHKLSPAEMFRKYWKGIQVNYLAYEDYTKGHEVVYGIQTCFAVPVKGNLHTSDFGIDKAPQWFREVKKGYEYIKQQY